MSNPLPVGFESLAPWSAWALATETERNARRIASTQRELEDFRDAMLADLDRALEYLDQFALADLDEPQRNLMFMALSLAEIAPAVELFGEPAVPDGFDSARFVPQEDFILRPAI